MPNVTIQGTKINRVNSAEVQITHGDAREATQIPIMQFVIEIPTDQTTLLQDWALAPQGPKRWKTVVLETLDRSHDVNHNWTLHKAYIHSMDEVEFSPGSGSDTDQGTFVRIVVRGTLLHTNVDYDGKNILEVKTGKAEAATS